MSTFYFFLYLLFQALFIAVFARAILSWFPMSPGNRLVIVLHQITEPILEPLRHLIPMIGMFDITPMVAMLLLQIAAAMVQSLI
jgi:YggT family protein